MPQRSPLALVLLQVLVNEVLALRLALDHQIMHAFLAQDHHDARGGAVHQVSEVSFLGSVAETELREHEVQSVVELP